MDEMRKRKPMLRRKPSVVIAIGAGKPEAEKAEAEGLACPKCGMALADTPENREYAKMRAEDMDESDDEMDDAELDDEEDA